MFALRSLCATFALGGNEITIVQAGIVEVLRIISLICAWSIFLLCPFIYAGICAHTSQLMVEDCSNVYCTCTALDLDEVHMDAWILA